MSDKVLVICGGKSVEHEISLLSAEFVVKKLVDMKYEVTVVFVDNAGRWFLQKNNSYLFDITNPGHLIIHEDKVCFINSNTKDMLFLDVDVVFPIIHGYFGEDGIIQGVLESLNLPYVGPSVLSAAMTFDKDITKRILKDAGIKTVDYQIIHDPNEIPLEIIEKDIKYPCFVKPAKSGSSIGIYKVNNREGLLQAIADAFKYDTKVIVEKFINAREIECGVIGNLHPEVSLPGELVTDHEFYSFNAKYVQTDNLKIKLADNLSKDRLEHIQNLAIRSYKALGCQGMARVDFFVTEDEVFVNEINSIPGFTKDSMFPKIWELSGLSVYELFSKLIGYAKEVFAKENVLCRVRIVK